MAVQFEGSGFKLTDTETDAFISLTPTSAPILLNNNNDDSDAHTHDDKQQQQQQQMGVEEILQGLRQLEEKEGRELKHTDTDADAPSSSAPLLLHHRLYNSTTVDGVEEEILQQRLKSMKAQCDNKWAQKLGGNITSYVFFDTPRKMTQCIVAKAGSTYWGRIFSLLTRPEMMTKLNVHTPFEIDRLWLHHMAGVRGKLIHARDADNWFGNDTLRFMFSRDPYKRLWSVFLDKYFLPSYWRSHPFPPYGGSGGGGADGNGDGSGGAIGGDNGTTSDGGGGASFCMMNATFQAFLEYAVTTDNEHWVPAGIACNPCVFRPHVIGKVETFSADTNFILRQTNYSYLLRNYGDEALVEREISDLTKYYFAVTQSAYRACFSSKSLAERIWRLFQYNGYIRSLREFPVGENSYSLEDSLQMFIRETREYPMSRQDAKRQRQRYIVNAYSALPGSVIAAIQARYEPDFELFGYNKNPPS